MRDEARIFGILVLSGIVGIVFAIMEQMMYANGILINEYISGTVTLRAVQLVTILGWMIIGIGVVAVDQ